MQPIAHHPVPLQVARVRLDLPQQFYIASKTYVEALLPAEWVKAGRLDVETVFCIFHEEAICSFAQLPPAHSLLRKYFAGPPPPESYHWYTDTLCNIFSELLFAVPLEAFRVPSLVPLHRNLEVYRGPWGTVTVGRGADISSGSEDDYIFSIRLPGGDEIALRVPPSIATHSPELVRDWLFVRTQLSNKYLYI